MDSLLPVVVLLVCRIFYCTKDQSEKGTSCTQEQKIFLSSVKHTVLLGFFSYPAFFLAKQVVLVGMKDFLLLFSSLLKGGLGWGKQQLRLHWLRLTPLPSPPIQWGTAKEFRYTSPLLLYSSAYNTWFSLFIWFREGTKKIGRSFFSLSEKKTASHKSGIDPCCRLLRQRQK